MERKHSGGEADTQYLLTRLPFCQDRLCGACVEGGQVMELAFPEEGSLLNRIYVGKIERIQSNIQTAFVKIADGQTIYVPLQELAPQEGKRLAQGDEVLVQITREAQKTKLPSGTGHLSFAGKYLVLTAGKCFLGLSSKLDPEAKRRLEGLLEDKITESYGLIARTNAAEAAPEELFGELETLRQRYQEVLRRGESRTCFSCVYEPEPWYYERIRSIRQGRLREVVTDDPEVAESLRACGYTGALRLYEDPLLPLHKLYALRERMQEALREKVWLKSGGYLVIQPTEALTVIDVNTGKYERKSKMEDAFLRTNLEAAREAARQMRLRNLSGIILIDFIDMAQEESRRRLIEALRAFLREDPVKTDFVDITRLGLAEITRKKVRKPLWELVGSCREIHRESYRESAKKP